MTRSVYSILYSYLALLFSIHNLFLSKIHFPFKYMLQFSMYRCCNLEVTSWDHFNYVNAWTKDRVFDWCF